MLFEPSLRFLTISSWGSCDLDGYDDDGGGGDCPEVSGHSRPMFRVQQLLVL